MNHPLDVVDLLGESMVGDLFAVKRLGANVDSGKPFMAVGPDGGLESILLSSEFVGIDSPYTSPDLGFEGNGGRDSVLESVAVAGGEELEGIVFDATFGPGHYRGEICLPVGGGFAAAIRL